MRLKSLFQIDIDAGVEVYKMAKNGILLDVRTAQEYAQGHIPESINIDLASLNQVLEKIPDKKTPVFVYCRSGARSSRAVRKMKKAGYFDVTNIGGIENYHGKLEK